MRYEVPVNDVKDPLRAARSNVLDAFARLERSMSQALSLSDKPCADGASLGQKIKHLKQQGLAKKLPANFELELEQLAALRNDIVHSEVYFTSVTGGLAAVYTNLSSGCVVPVSRIVNLEKHQELAKIVDNASRSLLAKLPAPPRPSPRAAGGP